MDQVDGGKEKFQQTLSGFMSVSDQIKAHNLEKRKFLTHVAETMRTESEARRQKLLELLKKSDTKDKPYEIRIKCLKIARRIMRGDKVSIKDLQYLMENDPELYLLAIMFRVPKEDPEEHECISDEENNSWDGSQNSMVSSGASVNTSASAAQGVAAGADDAD